MADAPIEEGAPPKRKDLRTSSTVVQVMVLGYSACIFSFNFIIRDQLIISTYGYAIPKGGHAQPAPKSFPNYGVGEGVSVGTTVGDGMGVGGAVPVTEMVIDTVSLLLGSLLEMTRVALWRPS